jgi:DNA-binding winged helix-turn-helix (wHTH) protein
MDALAAADIFLFQGLRLDRRGDVLFGRDQQGVFAPIAIGRRALDILGVLVERPGDLISRDDIIEAVWPGRTVEDSNLNVQVAALRRILDDGRADGSCIQTVSGRGYRFVARDEGGALNPAIRHQWRRDHRRGRTTAWSKRWCCGSDPRCAADVDRGAPLR